MLLELFVRFIMIPLDGRFLDGAIHPLDLSVSPRMIDLRQPMFDLVFCTDAVEEMLESPSILEAVGKLDAVVRENSMNAVRHSGDKLA